MNRFLGRVLASFSKEIKLFLKDKRIIFIFLIMPCLVIAVIKFSQNNLDLQARIGIIDRDTSIGYSVNDSFNYLTKNEIQTYWEFNESSNIFLNVTNNQVVFNTSTALQAEGMYFAREFNTITDTHNEILSSKSDIFIVNASLTAVSAGLGMVLGEETIIICGVIFQYGNITAINATTSSTIEAMQNNTLYELEMKVFLVNYTYQVSINGTEKGVFDFAINVSTFNSFYSYIYPSASPFDSVNLILDNFSIQVDSTPYLDLSMNLSQYFEEEAIVVYYSSEEEASEDLFNRDIHAYIIIPNGFEANITQDRPTFINATIDGTDGHYSGESIGIISTALASFQVDNEFLLDFIGSDIENRFVDDISAGPVWMALLVTSALTIALVGSSMITISNTLVGDEPLPRILLTPAKKPEILLSKFISYLTLSLIQIILLMVTWLYIIPTVLGWQQKFVGTIFDCFILMIVVSIMGIAFGFVNSAISDTREQASQGFITIFVPLIIIWLFKMNEIDPLTQGQLGFTDILFKGSSLLQIGDYISTLFLYAGAVMLLTFIIFLAKKRLV